MADRVAVGTLADIGAARQRSPTGSLTVADKIRGSMGGLWAKAGARARRLLCASNASRFKVVGGLGIRNGMEKYLD